MPICLLQPKSYFPLGILEGVQPGVSLSCKYLAMPAMYRHRTPSDCTGAESVIYTQNSPKASSTPLTPISAQAAHPSLFPHCACFHLFFYLDIASAEPSYISPLICSKCFNTAIFASKNLSTQFVVQLSSLPLSLPLDILPVMHFVQHMSVRLWIAVVLFSY